MAVDAWRVETRRGRRSGSNITCPEERVSAALGTELARRQAWVVVKNRLTSVVRLVPKAFIVRYSALNSLKTGVLSDKIHAEG